MGHLSSFLYLSPEQHAFADACIRRHRHARLDVIQEELKAAGIEISRSTIGRYVKKLREQDGGLVDENVATVVTIVDRANGHVVVLKTPFASAILAAHIEELRQKPPIS